MYIYIYMISHSIGLCMFEFVAVSQCLCVCVVYSDCLSCPLLCDDSALFTDRYGDIFPVLRLGMYGRLL